MRNAKRLPTITNRIVVLIVVAIVISSSVIGLAGYTLHRNTTIEAKGLEALHIAVTMARIIDGDKYEEIMETLEKNDYWYEIKDYADTLASELGTAYLYVLSEKSDGDVLYFAEGTEDEPFDLGTEDDGEAYADEMFETLNTGKSTMTGAYDSGEYGVMISGFAAVHNSRGEVSGIVGVDFFLDDILAEVNAFGLNVFLIIAVFIIIFYIVAVIIGKKSFGKPLTALDEGAKKLALGDMNIHIDIQDKTEIGRLSDSFREMIEAIKNQVEVIEAISDGDLTAEIIPRGANDTLGIAIAKLLKNLNEMFGQINQASHEVSAGSSQISDGSQTLAQGATEQAAAVEQLSASLHEIAQVSSSNSEMANKAAELAERIKGNAEKGNEQMNQMLLAVKEITEAGNSIEKVIKVVDDIAFQTNILALNAAVEAARAGQHGKGFAVVAEEVRNLASKSAEAAKNTNVLIANSIEKAELGAKIADETAESLREIVSGIDESSRVINIIAGSSGEQEAAIRQINTGVDQVSNVVQQNSAAAEQSAASAAEINGQTDALDELISQFKLKESSSK